MYKTPALEIQAVELAKFFKKSMLLEMIFLNPISKIVYDSILLRIQNENEIQSYMYPLTHSFRLRVYRKG